MTRQRGLADQQHRACCGGVHLGIGQETDGFELIWAEKMGFVNHQDDPSPAFVFFSGEQALGLGDQLGPEAARHGPQGLDDVHVQPARSHGRVGQVHDVMCGQVQLADGRAYGDGLADANFTGNDAEQRFGDAEADPSDGFLMTGSVKQVFRRDVL